MRKFVLFCLISLLAVAVFANFSLGLAFGEPSGLTAKYEVSRNFAVDFGVAYSFLWGLGGYSIYSDVLYLLPDVIIIDGNSIPLYAGVGASYFGVVGLAQYGGYFIRVRVPLGVYYPLTINNNLRIEPFFEIAPNISVTPAFGFHFSASLGARYIF